MKNKLSHSAASRFQSCPTSYKYHYIDRYRSVTQSAALLFGSAIDSSINAMLRDKDKDPKEVFDFHWNFAEVNGVKTKLSDCVDIVYSNSDYDKDLLLPEDIKKLYTRFDSDNFILEIDTIYELKEKIGFDKLNENDKALLNYANWLCLHRKGLAMIKTVQEKILPNIEEVLGVQVYVKLENQEEDLIIGYADLVCKWKGIEEPIIFDFKTSSREYAKDSVLTSPQLTLYVHALSEQYKTRKAGYIVLRKQLMKNKTKLCAQCGKDGTGQRHKTCDAEMPKNFTEGVRMSRCNGEWITTIDPEVLTQVIIDDIPEQTENIVLENFDYINQSIKTQVFPRNFQSCIMPWGKCVYFDKCYKGTNNGLIQVGEKK